MNLKRVTAVLLSAVMMLSVTASDISAVPLSAGDDGRVSVAEEEKEKAYTGAEEDEDELFYDAEDKTEEDDEFQDGESADVEDADDNPGTDAGLSEDEFLEENNIENGEEYGFGYKHVPREVELESIDSYGDDADDSFQDIDLVSSLPSEYTTPNLPPLRDQYPYGTCWAHSAMATAEISMMKQGLQNNPDYSELQLAYFTYMKDANLLDPLGGTAGDINRAIYNSKQPNFLEIGGNHAFSSNVLASWIGAADETDVPYSGAASALSYGLPDSAAYNDVAHLKNFYEVGTKNAADREAIKRIVKDCGSAEVSMYMISSGTVTWNDGVPLSYSEVYNSGNNCYYFPLSDRGTNHSVTVVGWNDSFPASRFASAKGADSKYPSSAFTRVPEGNGAWLIRNSWSSGTTDNSLNGYFWLSYYDKSLWNESAWGYEFGNTVYDNNYQYDGAMKTRGISYSSDLIYMADIFTAHACGTGEVLKAVSINPFTNTNVNYEINIYKNLQNENNPASGTVVSTVTGTTKYAGFYTVPLTKEVELEYGDKFSVVVKFWKTGDTVYAPVETSQTYDWYKITSHSESGQSYVSYNGISWEDVAQKGCGNIRIKAFTCNDTGTKYNVTLNANGGKFTSDSEIYSRPVAAGTRYGELPVPEREGYDFDGWYTSADGGTKIDAEDTVDGDITLYARWTGKVYTLTLKTPSGAFPSGKTTETVSVRYGETIGQLPVPVYEGYVFAGYYTTRYTGGEKVTGETVYSWTEGITVYARWSNAEVTVTFNANGGTVSPASKTVYYQQEYGELPEPAREGYNFLGWYTESGKAVDETTTVSFTSDFTLYAKWTGKPVSVIFNANGGTPSTTTRKAWLGEPYKGSYTDFPSVTREGYELAGWFTDPVGGTRIMPDDTVNALGTHYLYAHWKGVEYTLVFDANGGECGTASKKVTFGSAYGTLPVPTRDGYDFAGWFTAEEGGIEIKAETVVSEDNFRTNATSHKVYAHWTLGRVKVTLDPCGGTCQTDEVSVVYGSYYPELPAASRENYEFLGWYQDEAYQKPASTTTKVTNASAHTLYAKWIGKKVTVSFDGNGYTGTIKPKTVRYKEEYGNMPGPSREGYTPEGWFTQRTGGEHITFSSIVENPSDHTLYVHWEANEYTLTFDANGGECSTSSKKVTFGSTYGELPEPEWEGHEFAGWYTASSGGKKITADTTVSADNFNPSATSHIVYAQWTGKKIRVTLNANGGTCTDAYIDAVYGDKYPSLPVPVRENYDFMGWYTDLTGGSRITTSTDVTEAEPHTLYARWRGQRVTVSFDGNGYTGTINSKRVRYKENYGDLPAPERAGYKFEGWFTTADGTDEITKDSTVENSENHTLYAHWSGLKYTLEFDANGGTCDTRYIEVTFGSTYGELPEPEWEGHEFAGWYTASSGGKKITADTTVSTDNFNTEAASHRVYAHWTGKKVKVTLNANGGTCSENEVTVVLGDRYPSLPEPVKENYEFTGWYTSLTGGSEVTASTEVTETEPHTLYARWAGKKVTVSFDGNGYTRTIDPITPRYNETYGDLPEPVRPGYELIGWFTSADGADEITADSVVENSNDHTLYAHWSGLKYTLEFDPNGGTCGTDDKEVTFGSAYGELPDASRDGYDFAGWYTAASGGKKIEAQMFVSTQNFNLQASVHKIYAHWTGKQYTITLDANGGTVQPGTTTVTFGSTYGELPRPSRSGFTFSGWFTEATGGTQVKADTFVSADNLDITSDTHKLYAHWKGKKVRVRFSAGNLGNVKGNFYQKEVYVGEPYGELPEVEPFANYEFSGWFTKETGGDTVTPDTAVTASEIHTLYAQYKGKDIAVTFDVNGGRALPDDQKARTVNYDSPYGELPVPERDGHDFLGWYYSLDASDPAIVTDATNVDNAEAHTLYARWRIKRFTVTFDANGGYWEDDGNMTKTVTKEWNSVISEKDLSSSGNPISSVQKFDGWYKDKIGAKVLGDEDRVTEDVTVYAGWSAVEQGFFISGLKNSYTYTGEQIRPDITVYDTAVTPDRPLRENVDYTLSYSNNVNVGNADNTVVKKRPMITIKGKGNYQKIQYIYFNILPARLDTGDDRTFREGFAVTAADKKYNGSKQISKPVIKFGKKSLSEGKDYTVSYDGDTIVEGNPVNPGKVTVKVTAKDGGNFTGSAETEYFIYMKQQSIGDAYVEPIPDQVYTGRSITEDDILPYVTVKENKNSGALARGGESDAAGEYYVRFASGSNTADVGTVTLEIIGKGRFANSRKTVKFKIVAADIKSCAISAADAVYDGTAKQPEVTVTRGTGTDAAILEEGRDYTVSYSNNINAAGAGSGNKAPIAIIKGKGNYAGSSATVPFTIKPLALSASDLEISVPNQKAANGKTYDAKSIGGELKYYNPVLGKSIKLVYGKDYDTVFDYDARSRVQTASFVLKSNYENDMQINGGKIEKQFIIGAFLPSLFYAADYDIVADDEGLTYTGAAIKPKITVVLKTSGTRIVLTEGKDYKVSYSNNTNACDKNASDKAPSWKITGAGIFTGTVERKFTIHKRSLNDGFELSAADVKCNGKDQKTTVKVIEKATGKTLAASNYSITAKPDLSRTTDRAEYVAVGKGNYCGVLKTEIRVYEKAISASFFEKIADQYYTGNRILPGEGLVVLKASSAPADFSDECFEIVEYGPNTKLGTGTVTVKGKGIYGGTAVLKFNILPRWLVELRNKQD